MIMKHEAHEPGLLPVTPCMLVHLTNDGAHLQLCDLYENDCIFDKFDCALSGKGDHFATGTYNNFFRVLDRQQGAGDIFLEASRDPLRRRLATPARVS